MLRVGFPDCSKAGAIRCDYGKIPVITFPEIEKDLFSIRRPERVVTVLTRDFLYHGHLLGGDVSNRDLAHQVLVAVIGIECDSGPVRRKTRTGAFGDLL